MICWGKMSKHYLVGQASLQMAHRSVESELVGRIDSQQTKDEFSIGVRNLSIAEPHHKTADTYTQTEKFYSQQSPSQVGQRARDIKVGDKSEKAIKDCNLPETADTYTPTQIEKFYIKYPNWKGNTLK